MKKKALVLAIMFLALFIPLAIPTLPAKAQATTLTIGTPSPSVVKFDAKRWVYKSATENTTDPDPLEWTNTSVSVPWTVAPSGIEVLITQINIIIESSLGPVENLTVTTPTSDSGTYSWDLTTSRMGAGASTGDYFNLTLSMWNTTGAEFNSSEIQVYYSDTRPCADPTVDITPLDTSDSDLYTRGEVIIEWAIDPAAADWFNVTVEITNTTTQLYFYAEWTNWTSYGTHIWNTIALDIYDGPFTFSIIVFDNTTMDAPGVSVPGNFTELIYLANDYYALVDAEIIITMPLTSVESESHVQGAVNIFCWLTPDGLDPDGYGPATADLTAINFTLQNATNAYLFGPNATVLVDTLFSEWALSSPWWEVMCAYSYTIDSVLWGEGQYYVEFYINDSLGHEMVVSETFIVDNTPADVAITSPTADAEVSGTVAITYTIDETYPASAEISIGGVATELILDETHTNGTANTFTWDTTLVGDGEYAIEVTVIDEAGLIASGSIKVVVVNTANTAGSFYTNGLILGLGVGIPIFMLIGYAIGSAMMKRGR